MKVLLVLFFAGLAFAGSLAQVTESIDDFDKENNIIELNEDLKEEEAKRLEVVEAEINEDNEKYANGESSFGMKLYPWSDRSKEEIESEKMGAREWDPSRGDAPPERAMGGILPPESERINSSQEELDSVYEADRGYAPRSYFAVNEGLVTIAKNQGNCGSCAAFAASGLHETCMAKAGAPLSTKLDLSEQYLVDCGYNGKSMNGCKGAYLHAYTDWFARNGGVAPHEGSYPYLDKYPNLNCNKARYVKKWNSGAKVLRSIQDWRCNEEKLKKMVYENGAVLVGVYASDDGFVDYDGRGVFDKCTKGAKLNHAVLVVGYGQERNGKKYWLIKNSWGKNWGLNGHIKLARGTNECGVENSCISAKCTRNGVQETAPTTPKPPPIPVSMWCDLSRRYKPGTNLNGYYTLRNKGPDGGNIVAKVRCKKNKCTPATPGPSNACMFICGKVKC